MPHETWFGGDTWRRRGMYRIIIDEEIREDRKIRRKDKSNSGKGPFVGDVVVELLIRAQIETLSEA
jgi:hypothetical protein